MRGTSSRREEKSTSSHESCDRTSIILLQYVQLLRCRRSEGFNVHKRLSRYPQLCAINRLWKYPILKCRNFQVHAFGLIIQVFDLGIHGFCIPDTMTGRRAQIQSRTDLGAKVQPRLWPGYQYFGYVYSSTVLVLVCSWNHPSYQAVKECQLIRLLNAKSRIYGFKTDDVLL